MKKIFFALAALVLAFTGCSQEEDAIQVSEKKAVKVVVNMDKPGFGEDTRTPRTGWEDGDQVICTMGGPSTGILLTYDADSDSWTTEMLSYSALSAKYYKADFNETMASFLQNPEDAEGRIIAAYFSSGIPGINTLAFEEPNPSTNFQPAMVITTNASLASLGECVMTCENGEYRVEETASEYVLTLDIIMKPQVAQYTIRDLNVADVWTIKMGDMSPINMYAGGAIIPDGVVLGLIEWPIYNAYNHKNDEGISFYAAPWQSNEDVPSAVWEIVPDILETDDFYCTQTSYAFTVDGGGEKRFGRTIGYKAVEIGGAVIMDGPYTDGAEDKWDSQEK
ncbi:MAG: hypothetical protein IJP36_00830 [Bacteroides sp.]|nr:hypothetical protein [Bacteroides sp.]